VSIRDDETVEVLSPFQRTSRHLGRLVALAAVVLVIAAAAVALVPSLRQRVLGVGGRPIRVTVTSEPEEADVFIDEEHVGATPTEAHLAPGPHTIRIVRNGFRPWRESIDPSETTALSPTLAPLELGTLVVESTPDGASVLLDGDYRGVTPATIRHVEAGSHSVRLVREPMYKPVVEHVELEAGETRRIAVELESGLEALYQGRIQEEPAKLSNYTELLHLHIINQRSDKAVEAIGQALKALETAEPEPDELSRFYNELALVHQGRAGTIDDETRQRILDAVTLLFERLATAKPDEPELYRPLVALLAKAGQWDAIVKACNKAAHKGDAAGAVHVSVAKMYLGWGEANSAIVLLERAKELRPGSFELLYSLGSAYHRADRHDEALSTYLAAEKLTAKASHYYAGRLQYDIARLLSAKGDVDGAAARFEKAVKTKASSYYTAQWRYHYAELLAEHDRKDQAIAQYREILRQTPTSKLGRAAQRALLRLGVRETPR